MPATKTPKVITGKDQLPTVKKTQALLDLEKLTGTKLEVDPYKDPRLSNWLNKKVKGSNGKYYYPNKMYFQPMVSSILAAIEADVKSSEEVKNNQAKPGTSTEITPENSDVQPLFFAIVSQDDPGAVMDLVALVPSEKTEAVGVVLFHRVAPVADPTLVFKTI